MKILLTGSEGQLGLCFQDCAPASWNILPTDSSELDITNKEKVLSVVCDFRPDVIVNAAAYTAVDKAESEGELAALVNVIGPGNLAMAAGEVGAKFFHISTDYVFDGTSKAPYLETDETNPLSIYGKTKLDGEHAVFGILPDAVVIRTAWVFSEYGSNFVKTMLRLVNNLDELRIINDQRGCPTYAGDIAQAIVEMININPVGGIYNFCGDREVSWCEFAKIIFERAYKEGKINSIPSIKAIETAQYPTAAVRPKYSSLNGDKIKELGIKLSNWELSLSKILHG